MPTRDEKTAYHEAGHAVARILLRRVPRLRKVTIVSTDDSEGSTHSAHWPSFNPGSEVDERKVYERIMALLAGPVSEKRFAKRASNVGARSDHARAADLALYVSADEKLANSLLKWLSVRTEKFVEVNWWAVQAVAEALLEHKTLSGKKAKEVITEAREKMMGTLSKSKTLGHR